MGLHIRDLRTGRLYAGFNRWTHFAEAAFNFKNLTRAEGWMRTVDIKDCELVSLRKSRVRSVNREYGGAVRPGS